MIRVSLVVASPMLYIDSLLENNIFFLVIISINWGEASVEAPCHGGYKYASDIGLIVSPVIPK